MRAVRAIHTILFTMLTYALSRSFCQAFTEVNRRSYSTLSPFFRAFTTAPPPSTKCGDTDDPASLVTVTQLKSMLASGNVQLFDVREPDEYEAGRIPSAVNMPLGDVEASLKLPPATFEQKYEVKAPTKEDDNIVFHCRSGVRSGTALGIARQLGFLRARHLQGGYKEWEEQQEREKSSTS